MPTKKRIPLAVGTDEQLAWMEHLVAVKHAARALTKRLRFIHDAPEYTAVWFTAQNHNGPYRGPNYINELAELEALLERNR